MDVDASDDFKVRRRNQTACEACRATKIRCQPSEQPGVCRKCLESKRECISRTTPRTRRSKRQIKLQEEEASQASPSSLAPKASSTFSIDFAVPSQPEVDDNFEVLRDIHESHVDKVLLADEDSYLNAFEFSNETNMYPTPPTSTAPSSSLESLGGKPQFNLSSAETLLESFRKMLPNFPCIVLEDGDTVPHLANTRPFVLLAILAAASGSKTLQGHSLYDEEFRKVLGLKFVASGERTLELLQGILIYCAWYPFHLRPRNKQVFHYIRMCADLITDLELDQDSSWGINTSSEVSEQQLDGIRAYLGHCYLLPTFVVGWRKYKNLASSINPWTTRCTDILERNARSEGDLVLVTFLRLSSIGQDATKTFYAMRSGAEQQSDLILLGLETQAAQTKQRIPSQLSSSNLIKFATLFIDIYLAAGSLLTLSSTPNFHSSTPTPDLSKLTQAVPSLSLFLQEILLLDQPSLLAFTAVEWGRLVLVVILSFRASFSLPENPLFDHIWARHEIQLGDFLERFCAEPDLTASSRKVDTLSASRVVMRVVKEKYDKKMQREPGATGSGGCPMLDGSLEQYFPIWDAGLSSVTTEAGEANKKQQPVFHDLWATMTMSWANDEANP